MKTIPALPPPDTPWILSKTVLADAGLTADLHLLAPGAEHAADFPAPGETILFVVAGSVTVVVGPSHHILQPETTLRLAAGRRHVLRNPTVAPAKVLTITLPPARHAPPPALITLRD